MAAEYEIQGRRMERDGDNHVVRHDVRLASAPDRDAAFKIADEMVAERFTVWVFKVGRRSGRKAYQLLDRT